MKRHLWLSFFILFMSSDNKEIAMVVYYDCLLSLFFLYIDEEASSLPLNLETTKAKKVV